MRRSLLSGRSAGVSEIDGHGLLFERTHVDAVDWTDSPQGSGRSAIVTLVIAGLRQWI